MIAAELNMKDRLLVAVQRSSVGRWMLTRLRMARHGRRDHRKLEIGPGAHPIPGFETLNIVAGRWVDYVADAAKPLPFADETFELIYASHILEHVPWYQSLDVLKEWVRILQRGGALEIWVPDGLKICRAFVAAEDQNDRAFEEDGWFKFNPRHDPCLWASGRVFTYGDGDGNPRSPNWHRALFSRRYLQSLLQQAGLVDVRPLQPEQVRGADHGWINMGMRGIKP